MSSLLEGIQVMLMPPGFAPGGFDCGEEELNGYLNDGDALRDSQASFSKTYLVTYGSTVVGYFSILTDAIRLQAKERPDGVGYSSAPALKLGRLAIGHEHRGEGLGVWLLKYVVGMAREMSTECGCRYVTLDALPKDGLIRWYETFGFTRNKGEARARKYIRKGLRGIGFDSALPHVSMRYDILLEEEVAGTTEVS